METQLGQGQPLSSGWVPYEVPVCQFGAPGVVAFDGCQRLGGRDLVVSCIFFEKFPHEVPIGEVRSLDFGDADIALRIEFSWVKAGSYLGYR